MFLIALRPPSCLHTRTEPDYSGFESMGESLLLLPIVFGAGWGFTHRDTDVV